MPGFSRSATHRILYVNLACALLIVGLAAVAAVRRAHALDDIILRVARDYAVDPLLISAVIWKESRYDPTAVGKAGEIGLMQVMPATGMEWAAVHGLSGYDPKMLYDPETNVRAGTWYLAKGLYDWSAKADPLPYALAHYNAGRAKVLRWDRVARGDPSRFRKSIDIPVTARYISDILGRYHR